MKKQLVFILSIILSISVFAPFSKAEAFYNSEELEIQEVFTFTDEEFITYMEEQGYDIDKLLAEAKVANENEPFVLSEAPSSRKMVRSLAVDEPGAGGGTVKPGGTNKVVLRGEYTDVYLTAKVQKIIVLSGAGSAAVVIGYFAKGTISGGLAGTLVSNVLAVVYGDKVFYPRIFRFKMYRNSYIYKYSFLQ